MDVKRLSCILGFGACAALVASDAMAGLMHNPGTTPGQAYLDYAQNFPWVVPMGVREGAGPFAFGASGVVIAPGVVLMSAHQAYADGDSESYTTPYDGFAARITANFATDPGTRFEAYDWVVHPDFRSVGSGPDLALVFFEERFNLPSLELYVGPHLPGMAYDMAGFGYWGTPQTGLVAIDGNRRAGRNLLTDVNIPVGHMRARFLSPGEVGFHPLGMLVTPGHSGGGWFVEENGERKLAGISSHWSGFAGYGGRASATYFTPAIVAWIETEIASRAVPEPAALALAAGAAVGWTARRRRRGVVC